MLNIRSVTTEIGEDRFAIFRVFADFAGKGQQLKRLFKRQFIRVPSLWNAGAFRFFAIIEIQLDIRAETPGFERDILTAFRVFAQHIAIRIDLVLRLFGIDREWPGEFAFRIVRATDKSAVTTEL